MPCVQVNLGLLMFFWCKGWWWILHSVVKNFTWSCCCYASNKKVCNFNFKSSITFSIEFLGLVKKNMKIDYKRTFVQKQFSKIAHPYPFGFHFRYDKWLAIASRHCLGLKFFNEIKKFVKAHLIRWKQKKINSHFLTLSQS